MPELLPLDPLRFSVAASLAFIVAIAAVSLRPGFVVERPRLVLGLLAGVTLLALAALVRSGHRGVSPRRRGLRRRPGLRRGDGDARRRLHPGAPRLAAARARSGLAPAGRAR